MRYKLNPSTTSSRKGSSTADSVAREAPAVAKDEEAAQLFPPPESPASASQQQQFQQLWAAIVKGWIASQQVLKQGLSTLQQQVSQWPTLVAAIVASWRRNLTQSRLVMARHWTQAMQRIQQALLPLRTAVTTVLALILARIPCLRNACCCNTNNSSSQNNKNSPNSMSPQRPGKRKQRSPGSGVRTNNRTTTAVVYVGYGILAIVVIVLCLEQLRNDVLFADMVTPYIDMVVDLGQQNEEEQLEALELGRSILRGGDGSGGGMLNQQAFVDHEVKALVDGDDPDNVGIGGGGGGGVGAGVGGGGMVGAHAMGGVLDLQEQEAAWDNVDKVFAKSDAKIQTKWWNSHNIVHVIHTRVLQNQPRLVDFTKARLDQFMAFTLPSFQHQTTDEFLWILWTDPSLLPDTEDKIKALIKPMSNAVVIGYKKKRPDIRHEWFHDFFDQSYLVVGSYKLLMSYHNAAQHHMVLDTYVDADDAISTNFVASIQREAAVALSAHPKAYRYWCPATTLEWGYFTPPWQIQLLKEQKALQEAERKGIDISPGSGQQLSKLAANITIMEKGFFSLEDADDKCSSAAGTTIGCSANATLAKDFALFEQLKDRSEWHKMMLHCDEEGEHNCLGFMKRSHESDFIHNAVLLRSKTITSAATKSIEQYLPKHPKPSVEAAVAWQQDVWRQLHGVFGIEAEAIEDFRLDFERGLDKVLLDMLTICLPSNACRPSNKKVLQQLLTTVGLKRDKKKEEQQLQQLQ